MKLKVSEESTEQNNGGSAHLKYVIRISNGTYPLMLLLLLLYFLFYCGGDCFNKKTTTTFITHN